LGGICRCTPGAAAEYDTDDQAFADAISWGWASDAEGDTAAE
jgi:hypothetical protein